MIWVGRMFDLSCRSVLNGDPRDARFSPTILRPAATRLRPLYLGWRASVDADFDPFSTGLHYPWWPASQVGAAPEIQTARGRTRESRPHHSYPLIREQQV
jgi:hypothetical protein